MVARGVVWDGKELIVTEALDVRAPGPGEVKVRLLRSGICHSDLNMMDGGQVAVPVVLGHEGAGEIMELGEGVTGWEVGEAVMVGTQAPCGTCRECLRGTPANCDITWGYQPDWQFTWEGKQVANFANVSSFASEVVVKPVQLCRSKGLSFEEAALIGCAVSTGYGAVVRLGEVEAGDRVVVFGVGGIGVNAIQVARGRGAEVLAIDINPEKEGVARQFGATDVLTIDRGDDAATIVASVQQAFAPVDLAVECSGAPAATQAALDVVKRGGRVVLVGQTVPGATASLHLDQVLAGREIVSQLGGGARPAEDFPELVRQAEQGLIDIKAQVSAIWPMAEVKEAIAALRAGEVTRAMLDLTR